MAEAPYTNPLSAERRHKDVHFLEHRRVALCIVACYPKDLRQISAYEHTTRAKKYLFFNSELAESVDKALRKVLARV